MSNIEVELAKVQEQVRGLGEKLDTHITDGKDDMNKLYKALSEINVKFDNLDNKYALKEELAEWRNWRRNIPNYITAVVAVIAIILSWVKI